MKCIICGENFNLKDSDKCYKCFLLEKRIKENLENAKKIIFPFITTADMVEYLPDIGKNSEWDKMLQWLADNGSDDFLHLIDLEEIEEFIERKRR